MDELMIKIENVSKEYKLGQIGGTTLRDELQRLRAKILKKEDPTKRIGAKNYNKGEKFMALNGVSFEVKKGERVGIIGHNGAGKSTLLKLLSRVTAPTGGTISLNGRIASMLEVGTGFHPELTGRENIYMNGAILGMTKKEIDAKMEDIIEFSEVRQFIDTPVKRYSSGMYVKLAFSVAAHLDSEIMIMDEVLAVGDMKFQQKCLNKMSDVSKQEGRTVLYVSHNMNTIRQLCDRVIVLDHGKVVFDGDVEEGIGVYMGVNKSLQKEKYFDIDDNEKWCKPKVILKKVELLNDIYSIKSGDKLFFKINFESLCDLQDVKIRLVIKNNKYEILGMSMSCNSINVLKNKSNEIDISLDTNFLGASKYNIRMSFLLINEMGGHEYLYSTDNFFSFVLQDNPSLHQGMQWNNNSWGYFALPSFNIERQK